MQELCSVFSEATKNALEAASKKTKSLLDIKIEF